MTRAPERSPLDFDDLDEVVQALRGAGHRVSAATRGVLERLFAADGPRSAEQLAGDDLELTSVYRNLERLEELGAVRHVHFGHGPGLYALVRKGEREYLVCDVCGRVTAVEPAGLDPVRELLRR